MVGPLQPAKVAVTEMVPLIVVAPVFVAVKAGMLPTPAALKPIEGLLFVQLNVAPPGVLLKIRVLMIDPLQVVGLSVPPTIGAGFTVRVIISVAIPATASVTVTVYVVVVVGFATGFAIEGELNPVAGLQMYVYPGVPPLAVGAPPIVAELPSQIV